MKNVPSVVFKVTIILLSAVLVSSPTLWLIETPVKYFLYLFEVGFILLLSMVYFKLRSVQFKINENSINSFFNYVFLASSLGLLFLNIYRLPTLGNIFLTIIVSSFLPGYVLLRLVNFHCSRSYFETIVLSFTLSLPLTATISSFLSPIEGNVTLISSIYVILSFLPIVKRKTERTANLTDALLITYGLTDAFLIGLVFSFFFFVISQLYPQMAWIGGWDIARHYSTALLFARFPSSLSSSYPFFTAFEATVITLSSSPMVVVKMALACMSILVVISFYIMARAYLDELDPRLPPIATMIWFLFSGLGWVSFAVDKLSNPGMLQIERLYALVDKSYTDIGYGISPNLWLWFLPMTIGFTILFALFYLMKRADISRRSFVAIFSLGVVSLFFIHTPELAVLIILLFTLSFFRPKLRLQDAQLSTIAGLVASVILMFFYSKITTLNVPRDLISVMLVVTCLAYFFTFMGYVKEWKSFRSKVSRIIVIIAAILFTLYFAGFFSWLFSNIPFSMSDVIELQFIPWLFYPVRIGVAGALGLIGAVIVVKKYGCNAIVLFVCLLFSALFLGRGVSILNQYYITGYWEWRFLFFIFAAASILAPIAVLRMDRITLPRLKNKRLLLSAILLGIIVFSGVSSTFLTVEFQIDQLASQPTIVETNVLSFFSGLVRENIEPSLVTTPQSSAISSLVPVSYSYSNLLPVIWSSIYPEVPMNVLYNLKYPNSYIYMQKEDLYSTDNSSQQGYVSRYLVPRLPVAFNESGAQVLKVINCVPPISNSNTVLVVFPDDEINNNCFLPYDMLSLGGYNYTVMLDSDYNVLKAETVIMADDKSTNMTNNILDYLKISDGKRLIILNTNGYGPFSDYFFKGDTQVSLSARARTPPDDGRESEKFGLSQSRFEIAPAEEGFNAARISGEKGQIVLPTELEVNPISVKDDVEALSSYTNGQENSPFAVKMIIGKSEMIYVNVYPLNEAMLSNEVARRSFYSILGNLLKIANVDLPKYDDDVVPWIMNDDVPFLIFKDATLTGNVSVCSTSLIFPEEINLEKVSIESDVREWSLENVTSLAIRSGDNINILARQIEVSEGKGFYPLLVADSPQITIVGGNTSLAIRLANGSLVQINNEPMMKLSIQGTIDVYVRTPSIQNDGESKFREVYSIHSYYAKLRTLGQNLLIQGQVKFDMPLSDTYSFATGLTYSGSVERQPSLLPWNEWESIKESAPWLVSFSSLFVTLFLISRYLKGRRVKIRFKWKLEAVNRGMHRRAIELRLERFLLRLRKYVS